MNEIKKSDLLFIQNELLKDISGLDKKLSDKIAQLTREIQSQRLETEQKLEMNKENFISLSKKIDSNDDLKNIKQQFSEFKKQINQTQLINNTKIITIEKDLKNACFKYDNLFNNNISTPGLIGNGAKYKDIKAFREFVDKKISELTIYKEKNIIDIKKFKEKTENSIGQMKIRNDSSENKYFDFCYEKINEAKKELMDKFGILEESINNLKIENGKYSYDLMKKSEEIQNQINTLKNIEDNINNKLNEQSEKYKNYNNDLVKLFESQKEEFILIKSRFTELSEFIRDVRFMKNLNNYKIKENQNNEFNSTSFLRDSKMLSKKLNFDKPQKISKNDEIKYSIKIDFENNKENNYIRNVKQPNNNKEQEDEKTKIKYNIKTNINTSKIMNSSRSNFDKTKEKLQTETTESNSKNHNLDKISTSHFQGRNKNYDLIKESPINKTSREKITMNNKEDLKKNKSFIHFEKQNKIEDNIKTNNLKLKKINKNLIQEKFFFETNNNFKKIKDFEINNIEDNFNNENNENIMQLSNEIYKFIDTQILEINKKIQEMNGINNSNFEKLNKKIDLFFNLNNSLLLKFKNPKNLSNKNLNILTKYDYSLPLKNNSVDKNKLKLDKIKIRSKENISILNTKDYKDIINIKYNKEDKDNKNRKDIKDINDECFQTQNSGKILSIIEPYLIKKFRCDSEGRNNK